MATPDAAEKHRRGRRPALAPDVERRALLDAGLTVLKRSGYERATLDEVLSEAGLGTRAFYRHFASKDELLCAIYRRESESSTRRLVKRLAETESPLEGLTAWVDELLSIAYRSARAARARVLWVGSATTVAGYDDERARSLRAWSEPLVGILEAGRASDVFPDADPQVDAETINAVAWSTIAGFATGAPRLEDAAAARDHVLRFALRGIGYRTG